MTKKIIILAISLWHFSQASAQFYFDSTYIQKYYNNAVWSIYQNYSNHSLQISQPNSKDTTQNTKLTPFAESLTDVGIIYSDEKKFFSFNLYSIPNQPSERKPQPKAVNFIIGTNEDNLVSELGFNWFTGYYDKNSSNIIANFNDTTPYYQYNGLKNTNVFYNYMNFTNKRKFSYGAAYKGNALQKKSATSFVHYANITFNRLKSDSAFIPNEVSSEYDKFGQLNRANNTSFAIGAGYSATLVIKKVFFTNLTLVGGPALQFHNYSLVNEKNNYKSASLAFQSDIRFSIGVNFEKLYIVSTSLVSLRSYKTSDITIESGHLMNQFTLGLRLKRKGRIF
jgi:hypothetical protein